MRIGRWRWAARTRDPRDPDQRTIWRVRTIKRKKRMVQETKATRGRGRSIIATPPIRLDTWKRMFFLPLTSNLFYIYLIHTWIWRFRYSHYLILGFHNKNIHYIGLASLCVLVHVNTLYICIYISYMNMMIINYLNLMKIFLSQLSSLIYMFT